MKRVAVYQVRAQLEAVLLLVAAGDYFVEEIDNLHLDYYDGGLRYPLLLHLYYLVWLLSQH